LVGVGLPKRFPNDPRFELQEGFAWSTAEGVELKANLYLPKGAGPFPVVLYLHGGGWSSGDRKQLGRQTGRPGGVSRREALWRGCTRTRRSTGPTRNASSWRAVLRAATWHACSK
jgi:predicted acyl esterase